MRCGNSHLKDCKEPGSCILAHQAANNIIGVSAAAKTCQQWDSLQHVRVCAVLQSLQWHLSKQLLPGPCCAGHQSVDLPHAPA